MENKLFITVPIEDRHVGKFGTFFTSNGDVKYGAVYLEQSTLLWQCDFLGHKTYVTHTIEEVELPNDEEILEYAREEEGLEDYDIEQDFFVDGANYILNKLR